MNALNVDTAEEVQTQSERLKPKQPPTYSVVLFNDDYTAMEFVVDVLKRFFSMDEMKAIKVMWKVHTEGKASCGIFNREIAETKVTQVTRYARENDFPLMCDMEIVS